MFYYRIAATGEVLGAAHSAIQGSDWLARYGEALGVSGEIEQFSDEGDPRPAGARVEPQPARTPAQPDTGGLLLAIFSEDGLGKRRARQMVRQYPDAQIALERQAWPLVRAAVADMQADAFLTEPEHTTLLALLDAFNIP